MTQMELLKMHVEALFTMDENGRLVSVNEPWDKTKPAPLLYVGKAPDSKPVLYVRHDVGGELFGKASDLIQRGVIESKAFVGLFNAQDLFEEICYFVPDPRGECKECVILTAGNIHEFDLYEFDWLLKEIGVAQPCCAFLDDGKVVSVCRSVRISNAHEAGIETAMQYRGKGYAEKVLATWILEVLKREKVPLYSTSITNYSSQRVASKFGLHLFATGFSIRD